ncbi:MAG: methionine--tRNA ligase [Ruminococcus sp.]|jgi:methionyl-tRNA synthetase|nr:methionine--tRNA ligase [Ruminococcus sp.]
MKKYYLTTAIVYASGKPHIGNCYEPVFVDAVARRKRADGYDVFFLTGSDEHGEKIQKKAEEAGISPKEFVDKSVSVIKDVWDKLGTSYDRFIRTTDSDHETVVQKIFAKLEAQGDIYKSEYEGMYCTPCESFWTSSQLADGKCPDCGREVYPAKEKAYFLALSKYQKWIEDIFENNSEIIYPESRRKEMLNNFIKPGLLDLCVSRQTVSWGIPVPNSTENDIIYIWIDALSNYLTGVGYDPDLPLDGQSDLFKKYWQPDLQVIGKDIVRFHSIYWLVMLHCLGLPLPKRIFGHQWMLSGGDKMSKSRGNTIYSEDVSNFFGNDALRWFLLSQMPFGSDGNITYELMIDIYNADLANTLGNLVNRTIAMNKKYFGSIVTNGGTSELIDADLIKVKSDCQKKYKQDFEELRLADVCGDIMTLARRLNKYIDETSPWVLAKTDDGITRLREVLFNLIAGIKTIGEMIAPICPETAEKINSQIASCEPEPLFARIDTEKKLAEIEAFYSGGE